MGFTVRTDHQIVGSRHLMALLDCSTFEQIVTATRTSEGWEVHADGTADVVAADRAEAIDAMINHALTVLPGDGYSTMVPRGLREMP